MAYLRNWRKRNAEVLALAENSSEEDEMLGNVDEEVLSPTLSPDHSDIDVVLSSDSETPICLMSPQKKPFLIWVRSLQPGPPRTAASELLLMRCWRSLGDKDIGSQRIPEHCCKTPKKVATVEKCGGHYAYFGIASGILKVLSQRPGIVEHLHLCFNIDGVPLLNPPTCNVAHTL